MENPEERVRAAMGDASKWDHSLYPELMAMECEFVSSFYDEGGGSNMQQL